MPMTAQRHEKTAYTRGLWQFDGSLLETSGNNFHLSLIAGVERYTVVAPGVQGIKLFASSKYNFATLDSLLKIPGDMTILMLALFDAYTSGAIVSYDNVGEAEADNVLYSPGISASEELTWFHEQGSGADESFGFGRAPALFQPCHLVFRRRNTVVEVFINGRRFGQPSYAMPVPTGGSAASFWLGFEGSNCAACALASLRIDSRALSEGEIAAEYNRTFGPLYGETAASVATPRYATAFGGTDEYATVGNVAPLQKERTDSFSILVRFRCTSAGIMVLAGKTGNSPALQGYSFFIDAGRLTLNLNNTVSGANFLSMRTTAAFNDGNWHDALATYGGTSNPAAVHIYIDGSDQALTTVSNTLSATIATTAAFIIGARLEPAVGLPLTADVDDVSFYSAVVSGADAQLIAVAAASGLRRSLHTVGPAASLVGYWEMGDGATFPTIPDSSINNNPATMTNMEAADIFRAA